MPPDHLGQFSMMEQHGFQCFEVNQSLAAGLSCFPVAVHPRTHGSSLEVGRYRSVQMRYFKISEFDYLWCGACSDGRSISSS